MTGGRVQLAVTVIGRDRNADRQHFHVTENGVVLVTRNMLAALRRHQQG